MSAVVVRGANAYTQLELLETYRERLGQPILQANVDAIVNAIAGRYARDGYLAPEFQIDTTQLASGILAIDIFEPRISQVIVVGSPGPYRAQLERLGEKLRAERPLRTQSLQATLTAARGYSGLQVEGGTKPDSERNAFVLTLDTNFARFDGQLRVTNRGTRDVGREFVIGQIATSGLLGSDIKAGLLFGAAFDLEEFRGGGFFAESGLGAATRATLTGFSSRSNPTEHPSDFNYDYRHNRASFHVNHRWDNDLPFDLSTTGSLELDDQYIEADGLELQADRLRMVSLSSQAYWASAAAQYVTVLGLRRGLDMLGAGLDTLVLVEDLHDEQFTIVQLQAVRVARIGKYWQLRTDVVGQYSGATLPDRERFKIGGERLGRGFEVPAIAGDRGAGAKMELKRELPVFKERWGKWAAYAAYDIAAAWRNEVRGRRSAATGSVGVAAQHTTFSGYMEIARPLTHPDVDGNRSTVVFFEVVAKF